MKKIFFGGNTSSMHTPFWKPWGCLGCLWRLLLFIFLLLLLLFLLSLFRGCGDSQPFLPDEFTRPGDTYIGPDEPIEESDTSDWVRPIEGGEEVGLPSPEDNRIPQVGDDNIIPNPEDDGITEIVSDQLYVIFNSDANDETFKTFAQKFSSLYPQPEHKIQYYNPNSKTAVLVVPAERREEICQNLPSQIPEIDFLVVPVEIMTTGNAVVPNDPIFKYPEVGWYFTPIQAQEAWGITQGSEEVIVGIVDSYMDLRHDELKGNRILYPYSIEKCNTNVYPESGISMDAAGHGSMVTSIAVGNANNNAGSSGIAPKCRYIPVSLGEQPTTVKQVEGILYCIYHGADVINISSGTVFDGVAEKMSLEEQIKYAEKVGLAQEKMWDYVFRLADERNVTIVWAAGNWNVYAPMDNSKRNKNTIRVSAVDRNLRKANFSNYGNIKNKGLNESTISAPGVDMFGALPNNTYDLWPGTSFSAPVITGVVALMKSIDRNITTEEIIKILQETGKPIEGAPEIGKLVQIKDALLKVRSRLASFSDIQRNPDKLKGLWETTNAIEITENGRPTGEKGKIQLQFLSATQGKVVFLDGQNNQYTAQTKVTMTQDKIIVKQIQNATCPSQSMYFKQHTLTLTSDRNHLIKCTIRDESGDTDVSNLRKIR